MAKVISPIFSVMSGKIGGMVFLHGRGGLIIARALVIPINPQTEYQSAVRSHLTDASRDWGVRLTQAQRDVWEDYAKITPYTNTIGQEVILTGHQMYVAVRTAILGVDPATPIGQFDNCGCEGGMFRTPLCTVADCPDLGDIGGVITVTNDDTTEAMSGDITLSPPQGAAKNFYKGPYDPKTATPFGPIAAGDSEEVPFCELSCVGSRYFYKVRAFKDQTPHKISPLVRGSFIAVETGV